MRLTVAGLKGGPGKTLFAVMLARYLSRTGNVLLVDADPLSQSAMDWCMIAGHTWRWGQIEVAPWGRDLERRLNDPEITHVVFDTGGENDAVLAAALMLSDEMIAPIGTGPGELRRIPATFQTAARVDQVHPITARVCLNKVRANTRSAGEARRFLEDQEVPVMAAQVSLWQYYQDAYGTWPEDLGEFEQVGKELTEDGEQ